MQFRQKFHHDLSLAGFPLARFFLAGFSFARLSIMCGGVLAGLLVFWINAELVSQPSTTHLPGEVIDLTLDSVRKPAPLEEKIRPPRQAPEPPRPPDETLARNEQQEPKIIDPLPPRLDIAASDLPGAIRTGLGGRVAPLPPTGSDAIVPLVRVEPNYPAGAATRGIEGQVKVAFTVLPDGSVTDVDVLQAEPRGIFERAAARAVARWKFRPRAADAAPRRVIQTVNFRLPDAR